MCRFLGCVVGEVEIVGARVMEDEQAEICSFVEY